ncbi:MAG: hypothetical protein IJV64_08635 [Oscillospiraceae bacterium]|nr:hypothetical protein [Oscillospiraceae bacterium]
MRRLSLLLGSAALLLAGCGKQAVEPEPAAPVAVVLRVALDAGGSTKAYSDGTGATRLEVLVYRVSADGLRYEEDRSVRDAVIPGSTELLLYLTPGLEYRIACWAQHPEGPYALDPASGTVTVNPKGPANAEQRDAFFGSWSGRVDADTQIDVVLRRPFAQLSVLTTDADWQAARDNGIRFAGSSMSLTAPTVLDLISGGVSEPAMYALDAAAVEPDQAAQAGYKLLAMNYILAPAQESSATVGFGIYKAGSAGALYSWEVPEVPYQRGYRTFIQGNIFSVDAAFSVVIAPGYDAPAHAASASGE